MKIYNHEQTESSDEWVITHNLGSHPLVDILVPTADRNPLMLKIMPRGISYVDNNTVRVNFSTAYVGEARLIG